MGFEMNYCHLCGVQLAPDDFDGICSACDEQIAEKARPETIPTDIQRMLREMAREANLPAEEYAGIEWMDDVITDACGTGPAWAQEPKDIISGLLADDVATIITVRARFGLGPFV